MMILIVLVQKYLRQQQIFSKMDAKKQVTNNGAEQTKLEKRQKMKEKLLELQRKEQDRVRSEAMAAMEEAKAVITKNVTESAEVKQVKATSQKTSFLKQPIKNAIFQINSVQTIDQPNGKSPEISLEFSPMNENIKDYTVSPQKGVIVNSREAKLTKQGQSAFSIVPKKVELEKYEENKNIQGQNVLNRASVSRNVTQMLADSEVFDEKFEQMKKVGIKKLKKERKKENLTAMLKTVKRRKAVDLVNETVTELEKIEKKIEIETTQEFIEEFLIEEKQLSEKKRVHLELPLPKRFNPQKYTQWEQELEEFVPKFEYVSPQKDVKSNSNTKESLHINLFVVQAQTAPEPQLLKDLLESIEKENIFGNIQDEESLVGGIYRDDEDFSMIPVSGVDSNFLPDALLNTQDFLGTDKLQLGESKEQPKEEKKSDLNIYSNYDLLGGLEKINELEEEQNTTVIINAEIVEKKKEKSKLKLNAGDAKKIPLLQSKDSDIASMGGFSLSDEPESMRIKYGNISGISHPKSTKSSKRPHMVSQSLTNNNVLLKAIADSRDTRTIELDNHGIGGDKITLKKKRSSSFLKSQKDVLLIDLDDDFSCDTSQYSAFDESDQSSVLQEEDSISQSFDTSQSDINVKDTHLSKHKQQNQNLESVKVNNPQLREMRRTSTINIQAVNIALKHEQIGRDIQKTMDDARQTILEVTGSSNQGGLQKIEEESLTQVEEEDDSDGFDFSKKNKKQPLKKKYRNQKVYLRSLITAKKILNDRIHDGSNVDTIKQANQINEIGLEISTIIPLFMVDGDFEGRRVTHMHLVQDTQLHKNRTALKLILTSNPQNEKDFECLYKLSLVYFMLNKYETASGFISRAVQYCPKDFPLQKVLLWKGLIYFYYLYNSRKGIPKSNPQDKPKIEQQKYIASVIKSCEESLRTISAVDMILPARFILLKLTLMVRKEKFGCDLNYSLVQSANDIRRSIHNIEQYYGLMAKAEIYIDDEENKQAQAIELLNDLAKRYPQRIEAYLKLWQIYYSLGNFYLKKAIQSKQALPGTSPSKTPMLSGDEKSQTMQVQANIARETAAQQDEEYADKNFEKAVETAEKLLIFCTDITETNEKLALLLIITVKGYFKTGAYIKCFEMLQKEFTQNPNQSSLLYFYGKYVVKAMAVETRKMQQQQLENDILRTAKRLGTIKEPEFGLKKKKQIFRIDRGYLGSGIGALEECIRVCLSERHKKVNFYIGFAYKILNMPLKTFEFWKKADERGQKEKTLSNRQQQQVQRFQSEFSLFSLIGDKATEMIKNAQKSVQNPTLEQQNQVREYLTTLKAIEALDRPNSLLFQAKLKGYLVETPDESNGFGKAFEELIEEYPTFIDAYLQYWKYLKFRLGQLSGRALDFEMNNQTKKALKKRGYMAAAAQVTDKSGKPVLEKMHQVAEAALFQSACTEVPTSLCVDARIIYAKQMLYEKEVGQAIKILHEICYILPQLPIEGLSFVDTEQDQQKLMDNQAENKNNIGIEDEDEGIEVSQSDNLAKIKPNFSKNLPSSPKKANTVSPFKIENELKKQENQQKFIRLNNLNEQMEKEVGQIGETLNSLVQDAENSQQKQAQTDASGSNRVTRFSGAQPTQSITASHRRFKSHISVGLNNQKDSTANDANDDSTIRNSNYVPQFGETQAYAKKNSIYNPFTIKAIPTRRSSFADNEQGNDSTTKRMTTPRDKEKLFVAQSHQNFSPALLLKQASDDYEKQKPQNSENSIEQSNQDLVKEAMKKVQAAWIKTNEERQTIMGDINIPVDTNDELEFCDRISEEEYYEEDVFDQALTESENFTVYSNVEFLLLIGKYCAHSKKYTDQGLKALNDYLLILEYQKGIYTRAQYIKIRALTMFNIGCIFYAQKDIKHAMTFLGPILSDLNKSDSKKQYDIAQHKVSKMWRLQFNDQVLIWDYFAFDKQSGKGNWKRYNEKVKQL